MQRPDTEDLYLVKEPARAGAIEVATEVVATRIGAALGVSVPDIEIGTRGESAVVVARAMLAPDESLVHVKKLFIRRDPDLDRAISNSEFKAIHTLENVVTILRNAYPGHSEGMLTSFVRLLAFDFVIGNSDRHWENYGVVEPATMVALDRSVRLCPAFDNASCLFWNVPDRALPAGRAGVTGYRRRGRSAFFKAGRRERHADVLKEALSAVPAGVEVVRSLGSRYDKVGGQGVGMIADEFGCGYVSGARRAAIVESIGAGFDELREVTGGG